MTSIGSKALPTRFCPLCCSTVRSSGANLRSTMVDLNDVDGLVHLTWAIHDGVFLPGDLPTLTRYHDWQQIIARTMLHLIYWAAAADEHCPLCTVMSLNAEQAMKEATQQQGLIWWTRKTKSQTMPSSKAPKTLLLGPQPSNPS